MKKCKLALVGLLLVLSMGVLVACGNEKNEETGSNTDSGNNHESTGVIEEIVTDAATGVKDAVTEAGTILEDAGRGVEDLFSGNAEEQMTDSTLNRQCQDRQYHRRVVKDMSFS